LTQDFHEVMNDSPETAGKQKPEVIDAAAGGSEKAKIPPDDSTGNGTVDSSSILQSRKIPASPQSDSDSEDVSVFSGPPPPSLPDVDGVEEIFLTPRPPTFGSVVKGWPTCRKMSTSTSLWGPTRSESLN
jgi:hypothetical protein